MTESRQFNSLSLGACTAIGIGIGTAIGNIALGASLGVAIGAALALRKTS